MGNNIILGEAHSPPPLHVGFLTARVLSTWHLSSGWCGEAKGDWNLSAALHEASASEDVWEARATLAQLAETSAY